ncbi:uncharacterized protein LACBIDRAFT_296782 [Laccaria bicolor S238N-H82]|uniref:Predicted protein n=1 Tax=Laccaria bicolor (strain S238N-H82 / ATCC MYA-4686) TaxID=486041 RepID=B0E336_LACBS|nr:uncharacterized protein LACBIDRAFT_296782 [Laccaria bicolor S238N-H82]EDQ98755.1 predicted protein [Laccaria bicolor S238N-H82]|eukprot:XP_001890604.1 predicted protein [Laccaria bicolor S238N-H82]
MAAQPISLDTFLHFTRNVVCAVNLGALLYAATMGESGCMSTIVSCKEHNHSKHDIYDICETNEGSEVSMKALATRLPSSFTSPLSLRRDSFITLDIKEFFSVLTLNFAFFPRKLMVSHVQGFRVSSLL